MKRFIIIIAVIFGTGMGAFAQDGGLFGLGKTKENTDYREVSNNNSLLNLPGSHGESTDQSAPIGSGALLLIGFGAAYALKKQKRAH